MPLTFEAVPRGYDGQPYSQRGLGAGPGEPRGWRRQECSLSTVML